MVNLRSYGIVVWACGLGLKGCFGAYAYGILSASLSRHDAIFPISTISILLLPVCAGRSFKSSVKK